MLPTPRSLMAVNQVDVERIALFEAEDDAPVGGYADGPEPGATTVQRVQARHGG